MIPLTMTYRGYIRNGTVVFDERPNLPDGTPVSVQPLDRRATSNDSNASRKPNPSVLPTFAMGTPAIDPARRAELNDLMS